jgi:hypothetical protein
MPQEKRRLHARTIKEDRRRRYGQEPCHSPSLVSRPTKRQLGVAARWLFRLHVGVYVERTVPASIRMITRNVSSGYVHS